MMSSIHLHLDYSGSGIIILLIVPGKERAWGCFLSMRSVTADRQPMVGLSMIMTGQKVEMSDHLLKT